MNQTKISITGPSYPYSFNWEITDIRDNEIDIQLYIENSDEIGLWNVII